VSIGPGRAGLAALGVGAVAIGLVTIATPALLARWMRGPVRLDQRTSLRLLDDFSPSSRPIAIRYDTWRTTPDRLPPLFSLTARAGDERPPAPLPLLHDARWSLPAGRYRLELAGGEASPAHALGLQLGRLGGPAEQWPVTFDRNGRWSHDFELPLAVASVGLVASPALEAAGPDVRIVPLHVEDTRHAPVRREVLRAARYDETWVFFHDDDTQPEANGFWTRGGGPSEFTIVSRAARRPRVRLRAGPVPMPVRLRLGGDEERFTLAAGEQREITQPASLEGAWHLVVEVPDVFVPADHDPLSRDRRRLGCWVDAGG
jgi:hypothetical protein